MKKYLSLDVGSCKLKYAIINESLDVLEEGSEYTILDDQEKLFAQYEEIAKKYQGEVEGMTLSIPGVIDMETGFAYSGGVFPWVKDIPYAELLAERTGMKVAVCNDAKAAAFAEIGYGSLKKIKNGVLLMLLGSGIGGAVIVDGHLLNGSRYAAGEFSYIMGDYRHRDGEDDMFATACNMDSLALLVSQKCGRKMNVFQIMAGLSQKDINVTAGVQEYCSRLGAFIYNIQCVVDAERFVLSGSITDEPMMMEMINEGVNRTFEKAQFKRIYRPEIKDVVFHEHAKMYGAVYHFRQLYEEKNETGKV
ncbi:MAG: ROK family protein [Solobacterium sp.]|jgi:predicted NBD/HSP70 family sugar kinase|nr:ROK family protein [Solobacterium sp.]MCH4206654.1 ROK family protein [Solobacterium sp.]MCH4228074.1 ROK family protein [Solobacterium sp.]MCH4283506.1 ROK family protein [Solobacterium sp.]